MVDASDVLAVTVNCTLSNSIKIQLEAVYKAALTGLSAGLDAILPEPESLVSKVMRSGYRNDILSGNLSADEFTIGAGTSRVTKSIYNNVGLLSHYPCVRDVGVFVE